MKAAENTLLIVNYDRMAREALGQMLERAGYAVTCVATAAEGRQVIERYGLPQLILLAPHAGGPGELALCREIHLTADVPIIAVIEPELKEDLARLLESCADDFITWPAAEAEVVARVRRVLRRLPGLSYEREGLGYEVGALGRRRGGREAAEDVGATLHLSDREAALYALLSRHQDRVLSADFLLNQVWPDDAVGQGTLRVTIHRLRQKLERLPDQTGQLLSVRGRGYLYTTLKPVIMESTTHQQTVA